MFNYKDIPNSDKWITFEKIEKGWSFDDKYYIEDNEGNTFVLRTTTIDKYENKKNEYEAMKEIYDLGIKMSKPISFGICNDEKHVYILVSYIEGEQAEIVLPSLSRKTQYELGVDVGKQLQKLHSLQQDTSVLFEDSYTKKIHDRIRMYRGLDEQLPMVEEIIAYVLKNINLLSNRTVCLNHGDFHSGNIIITPGEKAFIIDFNRMKLADPYYEFNRIYFSHRVSPLFAKGKIDGYFNNKIPKDFFPLMKFYLLSVVIANIPWAMQFTEEDVVFAKQGIKDIYKSYNGLQDILPDWYRENI